ncbi:MAG: ribosomal protein S18-alanine N-acetyltransferase [Caldilineaceae bacterium]
MNTTKIDHLPIVFVPMVPGDVDYVNYLERLCFETPWSAATYLRELRQNRLGFYWVVRPQGLKAGQSLPPILAYGGYWLMGEDAHIATIATHPQWQQRGLAKWLLINMLEKARQQGATQATLEVRAGNAAAQKLYAQLGFAEVGRRRGYYPPSPKQRRGEDALLLTLFGLDTESVWQTLALMLARTELHFDELA